MFFRDIERTRRTFWANVSTTESCWRWTRKIGKGGYGQTKIDGRDLLAHRVAWELAYGPIPAGMCVCHSCDKDCAPGDITYRACVRPDHLFLGTHADNSEDAKRKGRVATGDRSPSRLHRASRPRGDQHWSRRMPAAVKRGDEWHAAHPQQCQGEAHPRSKLTSEDVGEIRRRFAAGDCNKMALAREYGVSDRLIFNIVNYLAWKHID